MDVNIVCCSCAEEIKGSVVILPKNDYLRLRYFGSSGCACETEEGKIVMLCCAHEEYYQTIIRNLVGDK